MLSRIFGGEKLSDEGKEKLENEWYDKKSRLMESILGVEHDMVMHALIPYAVGGELDLYYFPNNLPGTAVATKELSHACRKSSTNDKYKKYELVMFTREPLNLDTAHDKNTPFGKAYQNISLTLNPIAKYSEKTKINPNETCEFPAKMKYLGGKCLIFSGYEPENDGVEEFGMMAVIEIYRSEMEYAMEHGGEELIGLLKAKGSYPFSDMERKPVV